MGSPFFHEFKKQASFFLKEKIKTARLALTDVTPAQLLAEDATNGNPGAPDTRILNIISRAAFEIDDYWRIAEILHKRLVSFDRKNWWGSYKALIVLEHLLTHGPASFSEEFQTDKDVITEIGRFQHVDEKGFNWGLAVRKKSDRILQLLHNRTLFKEERDRARTVTKGIEGFGSFHVRTTDSEHTVLQESSSLKAFDKCNSQFNEHGNQEHSFPTLNNRYSTGLKKGRLQPTEDENENVDCNEEMESLISWDKFSEAGNDSPRTSFKENMAPKREILEDFDDWDSTDTEESDLLHGERNRNRNRNRISSISMNDEHPFNRTGRMASVSLLSTADRILQAC